VVKIEERSLFGGDRPYSLSAKILLPSKGRRHSWGLLIARGGIIRGACGCAGGAVDWLFRDYPDVRGFRLKKLGVSSEGKKIMRRKASKRKELRKKNKGFLATCQGNRNRE